MRGSIRRRTPTSWQISIYVEYDAAGRRRYVYETVTGTKKQAETRMAQMISEISAGRKKPTTGSTVNDLAADWWDSVASSLSPTTRRGYRRLIDVRILPAIGRKRVSQLTTRDFDKWYASLAKGTAPGGGPLGPRSIRHVHAIVSGMMSTAVRWEWIGTSPTERARLPRMPTRENRAPDADAVTRLIEAASIEHPEFATFLRLAAATGARRSELLALRWSDVNLERQELCIARSIAVDDVDGGQLIEKDTKTHQSRMLALDNGSVAVLRDHRERQASLSLAFGASLPLEGFLFSDQPDASRPWMPDIATHRFRRLCRRNGVKDVRLHDLRHYHGTMLADLGVPMTAVRDRLGHRDLQTTGIYAHGLQATDRVAAELIGNHLDSGERKKIPPSPRGAGDGQ